LAKRGHLFLAHAVISKYVSLATLERPDRVLVVAGAIFLDRDGTINEERHYLHRPEDVAVFPGAGAALKRLQEAGYKLFIVSNQSGVGRGYFTLEDVERVNERLLQELGREGVRIDKIYIAPESPDVPSRGRKPSPQFLFDARDEFGVDLGASYMIGDKLIDLECGWNAGVKNCILVRTGYGAETERRDAQQIANATTFDDLGAATDWILTQ
jgi:D-glycero-D-manno-heptose 1,7-bisphosphate phosphatase